MTVGNDIYDFVFGCGYRSNVYGPDLVKEVFVVDQDATPIRRVDLFFDPEYDSILVKIAMFDAEGNQLMSTLEDSAYKNKTSINLLQGEYIVGIRGR